MQSCRKNGFTLAELLIALAILGEIATFTIPKILNSQQQSQNNAVAREAFSMISGAYSTYTLNNTLAATTTPDDLAQYLNYVSVDTGGTAQIDDSPGFGAKTCNAGNPCYRLHNGAILQYEAGTYFNGTGSTNVLFFFLDPDGAYSGSTSGTGKSLRIVLHYNGRITSMGKETGSVSNNAYTLGASSLWDPDWFSW